MTASTATITTPVEKSRGKGTASIFVSFFEWFGDLGQFCARLVRAAVTPPYEIRELIHQCDEIGSKSLPLVMLAFEGGG